LLVIISRFSKKQEKAEKEFAQSQEWINTESYNDPQRLAEEFNAGWRKCAWRRSSQSITA
jgi:hypothetical protein